MKGPVVHACLSLCCQCHSEVAAASLTLHSQLLAGMRAASTPTEQGGYGHCTCQARMLWQVGSPRELLADCKLNLQLPGASSVYHEHLGGHRHPRQTV